MPERPAGKRSSSSAGLDSVVTPPPEEECDDDGRDAESVPDDAPREETVHDDEHGDEDCVEDGVEDGDEDGVDDDLLDARERRQSTTRKPSGPSEGRVEPDDVVIAPTHVPPVPPTEPA